MGCVPPDSMRPSATRPSQEIDISLSLFYTDLSLESPRIFRMMASAKPHKIFLIPELLELILLETDMRTLLTSAQRVCRRWYRVINRSGGLQAALFFKPVRYTLPRGTRGIRNPLLEECIWPWFCARQARQYQPPPVEGGVDIPPIDPQMDEPFFRDGASWKRMLFQQPPRSSVGVVEKDAMPVRGPAYTELKVQPLGDVLRLCDIFLPSVSLAFTWLHPLPEYGIIWFGCIPYVPDDLPYGHYLLQPRGDAVRYGKVQRDQVAYATSNYLQDCDVVIFTREIHNVRGYSSSSSAGVALNSLFFCLDRVLVPELTSIPMPLT